MKKTAIFLALIVCHMSFYNVMAANTLNMTINTDSVVRTVSDRMFGFNNEWHNTDTIYLADDYGKLSSFKNDFENNEYFAVSAEYGDIYTGPSDTAVVKYIKNGLNYTGNASNSSVMFNGELYEGQYNNNGTVNHPIENVFLTENNEPSFEGYLKPELCVGGLEGWYGFTSMYDFQFRDTYYTGNSTNMTVTEETKQNHALHMITGNRGSTVYDYFGKNNISLIGKTTCLSFRIKMLGNSGAVRLHIVQDGALDNIKKVWESGKYTNVSTEQMLKNDGKAAWSDAVTLSGGNVYLGNQSKTPATSYKINKWYTVKYYLNTEDESNAENLFELFDENGKRIYVSKSVSFVPEPTSNVRIGANLNGKTVDFNSSSDYAYVISAEASDLVDCYIDDFEFETLRDNNKTADFNTKLSRDMKNYPMKFSRMAGASAMSFDWKKSRGQISERQPYEWTAKHTDIALCGIAEWVKASKSVNPDTEFDYVINILDSNSDIADLVEYLTASAGEDLNADGICWGDKRIEDGIYEPVNIAVWELGNEMDIAFDWDVNTYANRCAEVIEILKQYSPSIPIAAHSVTGTSTETERFKWCYTLFEKIGNDIDYIVLHDYYLDDSFADTYKYIKTVSGAINCNYSTLYSFIYPKKWTHIKILFTEQSTARYATENGLIGGTRLDTSDRSVWHRNYDLGAAISNAEFYNRMFLQPIVEGSIYHSQSDIGPWQLIYTDTDGIMKPTLPMEIMKLYSDYGTGEVLYSSLDGFNEKTNSDTTAVTVRNKDGRISVFFTNRATEEVSVKIKGLVNMPMIKTTISSESLDDYNYVGIKNVEKTEEEFDFSGMVTLPARSVVALTAAQQENKNAVSYAEYKGKATLTVTGNTELAETEISLIVTKDNVVKHMEQTRTDKNGSYRFSFGVSFNPSEYEIKVWDGELRDISDSIEKITLSGELFDIDKKIEIADSVTANVNIVNKYSLYNAYYTVILAEYRAKKLKNILFTDLLKLDENGSALSLDMKADNPYDEFKVLVWTTLNEAKPFGK